MEFMIIISYQVRMEEDIQDLMQYKLMCIDYVIRFFK